MTQGQLNISWLQIESQSRRAGSGQADREHGGDQEKITRDPNEPKQCTTWEDLRPLPITELRSLAETLPARPVSLASEQLCGSIK